MDNLDFLEVYFANADLNINLTEFAIDIGLVIITAGILSIIYKKFGTAISNRSLFARNFIILALTTMMIVSIIKSSLALSLGLVGSLSIIRFRTAIKEPEELAYLFLIVALGVGFGAGQRYVTLVFFLTIVVIISIRGAFNLFFSKRKNKNMYLRLKFDGEVDSTSKIIGLLEKYCSQVDIERINEEDNKREYLIAANINKAELVDSISADLRKNLEGVSLNFIKKS